MTREAAYEGPDRDLVGYGRRGLAVRWPEDARIASNTADSEPSRSA